jgi:hypothetical protein
MNSLVEISKKAHVFISTGSGDPRFLYLCLHTEKARDVWKNATFKRDISIFWEKAP